VDVSNAFLLQFPNLLLLLLLLLLKIEKYHDRPGKALRVPGE